MRQPFLLLLPFTLALGCAYGRSPDQLDTSPCLQWRVVVSNPSPEEVAVYASGEGPERFLGFVGSASTKSWIVSSEPERVEARGGVRDEVKGVEIAVVCLSR